MVSWSREQLVVVDPDAQVAVGPAAQHDVAHAGDDAQPVAQVQVDEVEHLGEGPLRDEVIASHMIGLSSVLILSIVGGCTSLGSLTERSLEFVSCSAASMSLPV